MDNKIKLDSLIERYYNLKEEMDSYKKQVDEDNAEIKSIMRESNLNKEIYGDFVAKYQVIVSESFDDAKLLLKIKELGLLSCIKTREYVDMEELENCIYNGEIDAKELTSCKVSKTTERLTVRKKKEGK